MGVKKKQSNQKYTTNPAQIWIYVKDVCLLNFIAAWILDFLNSSAPALMLPKA